MVKTQILDLIPFDIDSKKLDIPLNHLIPHYIGLKAQKNPVISDRVLFLGGRPGSNRRPSVPQTDALTSWATTTICKRWQR